MKKVRVKPFNKRIWKTLVFFQIGLNSFASTWIIVFTFCLRFVRDKLRMAVFEFLVFWFARHVEFPFISQNVSGMNELDYVISSTEFLIYHWVYSLEVKYSCCQLSTMFFAFMVEFETKTIDEVQNRSWWIFRLNMENSISCGALTNWWKMTMAHFRQTRWQKQEFHWISSYSAPTLRSQLQSWIFHLKCYFKYAKTPLTFI